MSLFSRGVSAVGRGVSRGLSTVSRVPGASSALTVITGGAAALNSDIRQSASREFMSGAAAGGAIAGAGALTSRPAPTTRSAPTARDTYNLGGLPDFTVGGGGAPGYTGAGGPGPGGGRGAELGVPDEAVSASTAAAGGKVAVAGLLLPGGAVLLVLAGLWWLVKRRR